MDRRVSQGGGAMRGRCVLAPWVCLACKGRVLLPPIADQNCSIGNSLFGFSCESQVFSEQKSKIVIRSFPRVAGAIRSSA